MHPLQSYLKQHYNEKTTEELQALHLDDFLTETREIALSSAERLRRLAIYIEENHPSGAPAQDWQLLRTIYLRAMHEDPDNIDLIDSYGISATGCAEVERDAQKRDEMLLDGEEVLRRGLELQPNNGRLCYNLGLNLYKSSKDIALALTAFEGAVSAFALANSEDRQRCMAQLYVGHCLQDQKNWRGALEAYQRVDEAALARDWPRWRTEKRKEQMALCHLKLGEHQTALRLFEEVLSSYEALSLKESDELALPDELVIATTGELREALYERTKKMLERLELTKRYRRYL